MKAAKFLVAGLLTAVIDNGVFIAMHRATGAVFLSLVLSTALSVTFNYLVCRAFVFETKVPHSQALPKYLLVHGLGLLGRWSILRGLMALFHLEHWGIYVAKLAADASVYSLKYFLQRDFVFKDKTTRSAVPESGRSGLPVAPESIPPSPTPRSEPSS